ncbi:MAG: hypothetical protein ACJ8CR_08330 [Roseiflexaceae bacterium]
MRDFSASLRSVILDSTVPSEAQVSIATAQSHHRALAQFFRACASDTRCNATYPKLEHVFDELVQRLDQQPAHMYGGW